MRLKLGKLCLQSAYAAAISLVLSANALSALHPTIDSKPNVIIVLTDDQGYGDMSCHGNPFLQTPAMDTLYRASVRLTDFHVDPTCSPTRAALMTGRYSTRVGVWLTYGSRHHLQRDEVTMANVFRDNGYRTAIFGKWHLGDNYPFRPQDRGFDESLIHGGGMIGETPDYWDNDYYDDVYFRNGEPESVKGYCTDVWFDEAINFIDNNNDRPFFLYLPTNAPHGPLHVPEKYTKPFRDKPGMSVERACFYGMIACIDENLGRLRKHLTDSGLERDTIIVFMNDNGTGHGVTLTSNGKPDLNGWTAEGFNAGLRGRKASAYEGGHRAACFIHWPAGGLVGGRDLNGLTAHLDIMPTLIELCGLKPSKQIKFDGMSLASQLGNPAWKVEPRTLLVHHQGRFGTSIGDGLPIHGKDFSVMTERWRMVGKELYDIHQDPEQRTDVSAEYPDVQAKLLAEYERWWTDISKSFDTPNPFIIDPQHQRVVSISSQNLLGGNVAYSQQHVRNAMPIKGCWTWIDVQTPGSYRITVRRWPHEINKAMSDALPVHPIDPSRHEVDNRLLKLPSRAIPVAQVRLRVGDFDQTVEAVSNAQSAEFLVPLKPGLQKIQSDLISAHGDRTAAYYMYIEPHGNE